MDNMTIINNSLNRDDFMQQGLLLNTFGKERMTETIEKHINQLMSKRKELLILLKWEEYKSEDIHEEIKEHLNCGDTDEKKR
jgi:DNA-directed RNA polymerase specialized sigma24 family protein